MQPLFSMDEVEYELNLMFENNMKEISEMEAKGPGWKIVKVQNILLRLSKYRRLLGSSYIPLPTEYSNNKNIVNVRNYDDKYFLYSILAPSLQQQ